MIRIKDIAKQAGVSATTVSNVIHGNTKRVSPQKVEVIKKLIEDTNYVPSMAARLLAQNSSNIVGVIVTYPRKSQQNVVEDPFTGALLGGIEESLRNYGYYMMLYAAEDFVEIFKLASTWKTDGLIILGFTENDCVNLRKQTQIPFVTIDSYLNHPQDNSSNIGLDDFDGGYGMGKYLIECGHRKTAFLSNNNIGVDYFRWQGFQKAFEEAGIPLGEEEHILLEREKPDRRHQYKKLLKWFLTKTVLFFSSDYYAVEAMDFLWDQQIRVPEDISVAGFDDNAYAEIVRPKLTTVRQDVYGKAAKAVTDLLMLMSGEEIENTDKKLPVKLVVRDSVKKL